MIRTGTNGVFQSDVLIRAAIIAGIDEIRQKPWLLDYVFSWLPNDPLTSKTYGAKELQEAKNWFLSTEVAVVMAYRTDQPQLPCIGIELVESTEAHATIGDVHYETSEDVAANEVAIEPDKIVGPFTPKAYDIETGIVTMPDNQSTAKVFAGMYIFDTVANRGYQISEVLSDQTFKLDDGTKANFTNCYIAGRDAFWTIPLYSMVFRESYRMRCFVTASPIHLSFLYSVLLFVLMRGKKDLLEARGFENFTIAGSGFAGAQMPNNPEMIFTRDITVTGIVRQYWPGNPGRKLDGILVDSSIMDSGKSPNGIAEFVSEQGWELEDDQFGALRE